jgi:hypothetical protein
MRSSVLKKELPDHHDADLVIKLYELRREPVMRESRSAINREFWPKTFDDVLAVRKSDHPLNAPFRQTHTYWEMVYGMAKYGIIHPDFMMESCSEGLYLFARMEPFVAQYREKIDERAFMNAQWITNNSDAGKRLLEHYRRRVQQVMATK